MIDRTTVTNAFEFVTVSGARARQLLAGCTPRVDVAADTKKARIAQQEVLCGAVRAIEPEAAAGDGTRP